MAIQSIVSTVSLVLKQYLDDILATHSDLKAVYEPTVSYNEGIGHRRNLRIRNDEVLKDKNFPLFVFSKEGPRIHEDASSMTRVTHRIRGDIDTQNWESNKYLGFLGSMLINWIFVTDNMEEYNNFHILYGVKQTVNNVKLFQCDFGGEVGVFQYNCKWSALENAEVTSQEGLRMVVGGTCEIAGEFIALDASKYTLITEINADIKDFNDAILSQIVITAN